MIREPCPVTSRKMLASESSNQPITLSANNKLIPTETKR